MAECSKTGYNKKRKTENSIGTLQSYFTSLVAATDFGATLALCAAEKVIAVLITMQLLPSFLS